MATNSVIVLDNTDGSGLDMKLKGANGAASVSGLAGNFVRHSTADGTYNTTDVYGFTILVPGTSTLLISAKVGGVDTTLTSAEVIALQLAQPTLYVHCDLITLSGGSGTELLLYIG